MKTFSIYRNARSSPQKLRLVSNLIKNKKIEKAMEVLNFLNKKSSFLIKKVLVSAVANAHHNYGASSKILKIKNIFIDEGPTMKRTIARAKGRTNQISKRTSHIKIVISDE
ncbi:50S ribosomal protein L22 [Candidatus Riesia pediculicola]|uniref:Large ribosomal subunit protein uL22 n=1 Tax=Riesia pediculicola (strain USDA) TaxID=515618 RepID=D4G8M9_RIEPU|nr:50S ribosomal protein L22 [Candidatus Riesia pediculicola]ADD79563.1 ribosomal protein L22 [Candidatus Riesia pediculicola USDA]ARC53907.1 50S ribosomal protein L22 [Candidatus Riesia pediculicola]ARC54344.1 50S ribosomal protein L22 [Candidatus Riesia pediculicola]QOJ86538.1 50S ribosomal protein L22 [Candidatus Riesia pediculicola]